MKDKFIEAFVNSVDWLDSKFFKDYALLKFMVKILLWLDSKIPSKPIEEK